MEPNPVPNRSFPKGTVAVVVGIGVLAGLLIEFPAYRLLLLAGVGISIGIGVAVAGALYLYNKHVPVKEEDVENKRPLGLS